LVDSNFTKALPNLYRFIFSFGKVGAFKLVLRHFRECESVQCALASISDRFRTDFSLHGVRDYLRLPEYL